MADRERGVHVGHLRHVGPHELVPRHLAHHLDDPWGEEDASLLGRRDLTVQDDPLHHLGALVTALVVFGHWNRLVRSRSCGKV